MAIDFVVFSPPVYGIIKPYYRGDISCTAARLQRYDQYDKSNEEDHIYGKVQNTEDHVYDYIADQIRSGSPPARSAGQRKRHLRKLIQPHPWCGKC